MKSTLKTLLFLAGICFSFPHISFAQGVTRLCVESIGANGSNNCVDVGLSNPFPVSGTFSATLTGFSPASIGTPINATTSGSIGTLPAGTSFIAQNVGSYPAYCQLGGTVTSSSKYIASGGAQWGFSNPGGGSITCEGIGGTTTINLLGGSGLPVDTNGSGSGGSGGTVTQGPANTATNAWPVYIAPGGVANSATNPVYDQLIAGSAQIGSVSLTGNLPAFSVNPTFNQGTPAVIGNAWPTYIDQGGTAVGSGNPLYVQGSFSATSTGFIVAGTAFLGLTGASQHVALPGGGTQILVSNPTDYQLNALLDTGSTTVTATNSTPIPAGGCQLFNTNGTQTSLGVLSAGSTGNVIVQSGSGIPLGCAGAVAQSGAWTVAATQSGTWNIGSITTLPAITGTVTANIGTIGGIATAANQPTNTSQGSSTTSQTGGLAFGAATSVAPTDNNGDSYPLSLTTAGALRTDASATTQPVSASALPLPSGAATSALQTNVQAAAGISSSNAVGVQGVAGGVALPISAATLPLATNAATASNQTSVESAAGTASSQVLNIQGNGNGIPIPISGIVSTTFDGFIVTGVNSVNLGGGVQHIGITGGGPQVLVSNSSNYEVYAILDTGSASPTPTTGTPIAAGSCQFFNTNASNTDVAIYSTGSSGSVIVQSGTGTPLSCPGSASSGGGGTVAQGTAASASGAWPFYLVQGTTANSSTNPIFTQITAGTAAIGSLTQGGSVLSATNGLFVTPTTSAVFETSAASGSYVDGAITTIGAEANSACAATTGPCTLIAIEKLIANSVSGPIPAGTNTIGAVTQASGPWTNNLTQVAGVSLGSAAIQPYGGPVTSGNVPAVNAFVTNTPTVLQGGGAWSQSITSPLGAATASTAAVSTTPVYQNITLTTSPSVAVEGGGYIITPYATSWGTGPETITISANLSSGASQTISPSGGISSNITPYCVQLAQGATVQYAVASGSGATGLNINLAGSPGCASVGGSSTVAQGTPAVLSGAWPLEITDGTHGPVAVKAASTAPASTDPSLVVSLSPNSQGANLSTALFTKNTDGTNVAGVAAASTPSAYTAPALVVDQRLATYTLFSGNAAGTGTSYSVPGACYLIYANATTYTSGTITAVVTITDPISNNTVQTTLGPFSSATAATAISLGAGVNVQATVTTTGSFSGLNVRMVGTDPGACSNGGGSSSTVTLATQSPGISVGGVGITPPTYSQGGHITPIVSTVLESTHTFNPNSGLGANLYGIYANNTGSQSGFLVCVNGTSISSGAITPLDFTQINANSNANINYMPGPAAAYSIAITCAVTVASTPFTYTSPGNVVAFHGMVN